MLAFPPGGATMRWVVRRGTLSSTWAPARIRTTLRISLATKKRQKRRLTGQTEAGLVEVAYGLVRDVLLLLLLLPDRGRLPGGRRGHHLGGQNHIADRPVVLASGDASQLRQLKAGKVTPDFHYPFLLGPRF